MTLELNCMNIDELIELLENHRQIYIESFYEHNISNNTEIELMYDFRMMRRLIDEIKHNKETL